MSYRSGLGLAELVVAIVLYLVSPSFTTTMTLSVLGVITLTSSFILKKNFTSIQLYNHISVLLLLDAVMLTVFLGFAGGPSNPFSILYLVQVMMASILLKGSRIWWIPLITSLLYGLLFVWHVPLPEAFGGHDMMNHGAMNHHMMDHSMHAGHQMTTPEPPKTSAFSAHLYGMWIAFTLMAFVITTLISRIVRALEYERVRADRSAKLLGLATIAAGAAHELSTPLSTIKIANGELRHMLDDATLGSMDGKLVGYMLDEVQAIDQEILRTRTILDRLALDAGQIKGENLTSLQILELVITIKTQLPDVNIALDESCREVHIRWPVNAIVTMLSQLVRNARDANAQLVVLRISCTHGERVLLTLTDDGDGLDDEYLDRYGEPFFTTKPTGAGMGMGLFLARSLCEQLGGSFHLSNRNDNSSGCVAELTLPQTTDDTHTGHQT